MKAASKLQTAMQEYCTMHMKSLANVRVYFLSHLLIAGCDIGVQISVRPFVRLSVRLSAFTSKFGFLYISDSKECETLHSNCP